MSLSLSLSSIPFVSFAVFLICFHTVDCARLIRWLIWYAVKNDRFMEYIVVAIFASHAKNTSNENTKSLRIM